MANTFRELESENKEAQYWILNAVQQKEDPILQINELSHENQLIELKTSHGATETLRLLPKAKQLESLEYIEIDQLYLSSRCNFDARAKISEMPQKSRMYC